MADIEVSTNGPYAVHGLDLIRLRLHPAADPQEQAWVERESVDVAEQADESGTYWLCRCGHSANKPFCDGSHKRVGFDGTETAPRTSHRESAKVMEGSGVVVRDVRPLCEHAGFCTLPGTNVWAMVTSDDPEVLAAMRVMIDHCPSGALTRAEDVNSTNDSEPVLPRRVAVVDDGPYLVTGGVSISGADGQPHESRNRMTLCRCGASASKPFCDGSHAKVDFHDE
ncbi:MAG: CDGSH iron-sulfur domain-containing protein [Tetrasphaera sp.]